MWPECRCTRKIHALHRLYKLVLKRFILKHSTFTEILINSYDTFSSAFYDRSPLWQVLCNQPPLEVKGLLAQQYSDLPLPSFIFSIPFRLTSTSSFLISSNFFQQSIRFVTNTSYLHQRLNSFFFFLLHPLHYSMRQNSFKELTNKCLSCLGF